MVQQTTFRPIYLLSDSESLLSHARGVNVVATGGHITRGDDLNLS